MRIELERPLAWPVRPVQTSAGLHVSATSILIACADRALGIGMHDAFERNGHRIHVTHDPIAALDTLEADGSIGIVAVELALPHFDGLALVERMRKSVQRHLQVIVVAPNATAADVVRAMHLRAADFVSDPQDGSQLHGALARALAAHQAAAPLPAPPPPAGNGELHGALEDAYRHGLALIEAVKALREGQPTLAAPAPARPAPTPVPAAAGENRRLAVLRTLQQSRVARDKYFPKGLFEDPCWDMLLDLMANHLRGRRISVSSLCMASGVAQTTALRRITELHDRGLVRRIADEKDGRRVFIELTEQGIAALSGYVEHIQELT